MAGAAMLPRFPLYLLQRMPLQSLPDCFSHFEIRLGNIDFPRSG